MKHVLFIISCCLLLTISCSEDDKKTVNSNCDKQATVINDNDFQSLLTTNYTITNVVRNGDCLSITISASGCNSSTIQMDLFGSDLIINPVTASRPIKVKLANAGLCLAVFEKTVSFDLVPFRITNQNQVQLNLDRWSAPIIYSY